MSAWDRGRLARNERAARTASPYAALQLKDNNSEEVEWVCNRFGYETPFALRAHCGRDARGPSSCGRDARGPGSCGRDARGPGSCGRDARGPSSCGRDARGPGSCGRDARGPSSCGRDARGPSSCGRDAAVPVVNRGFVRLLPSPFGRDSI
jgi:hypothetical protein